MHPKSWLIKISACNVKKNNFGRFLRKTVRATGRVSEKSSAGAKGIAKERVRERVPVPKSCTTSGGGAARTIGEQDGGQ